MIENDIIALPDNPTDPAGPATIYIIPKSMVLSYIKMTPSLSKIHDEILRHVAKEALRLNPKAVLKAALGGMGDVNEIPPELFEVTRRPDIIQVVETLTTRAIAEYREFLGDESFREEYELKDEELLRELQQDADWATFSPKTGWKKNDRFEEAVDMDEDGTMRLKVEEDLKEE